MHKVKTFSLLSGLLGFVVVALGAWTRLADAGLGCPDWPGCYGFVTIPMNPEEIDLANSKFPDTPYEVAKAIPEVVHRYFAAALGFFILCMNIVVYRIKEEVPSSIKYLTYFLLAWVILQGTFGYLTVSLKLLPQIVTGSSNVWVFNNFTYLASYILKLKRGSIPNEKNGYFQKGRKKLISAGMFLVTVQIFLGA
jgi:Uncharacterized protein required for cytochrome oxidase assembly